ncbi:MAG: hypothetical protein LBV13_05975 [Methanomassiliicoccaceae archaeon]|jgi:ADP-ribose pyrophosphatase YjhB (NUDIX family)|nr:hypothetical protein [Methanomassiliicoccaceae archaeon]
MESIARTVRGGSKRLKASDASPEQMEYVIRKVSNLNPETYGVYAHKRRRRPNIWNKPIQSQAYRNMMRIATKDALKTTKKNDFIVLADRSDKLGEVGENTIKAAFREAAEETGRSEKNMKSFRIVNSAENDMMQTQDFIASAVKEYAEGDKRLTERLRMNIREAIRK